MLYVSVNKIGYDGQALLLHFDLPMDQNAHGRVEENDRAEYKKLAPLAHDHRAQNLAAELEAQRERDALRNGEPRMWLLFAKSDDALYGGEKEDHRSGPLQQNDPELYKIFQHSFRPMK